MGTLPPRARERVRNRSERWLFRQGSEQYNLAVQSMVEFSTGHCIQHAPYASYQGIALNTVAHMLAGSTVWYCSTGHFIGQDARRQIPVCCSWAWGYLPRVIPSRGLAPVPRVVYQLRYSYIVN
eukprot:496209-Rhodomonas_salina.1